MNPSYPKTPLPPDVRAWMEELPGSERAVLAAFGIDPVPAANLTRLLRPDGQLCISVPFSWKFHGYPSDYWRFTPDAFRSLLKPFTQVVVESAGREIFPHTVIGVGVKEATLPLERFEAELGPWKRRWWNPKGRSWETAVFLLTPPLLIDAYRKLKRKSP